MILLNGTTIKPTIFPDGTSQVWKLDNYDLQSVNPLCVVEWRFGEEAELLWVAQLCDLISYTNPSALIHLDIPYLPYGRQDKDISNHSTFALRTFARMLNTLPVFSIGTIDAHSELAEERISKLYNHSPKEFIERTMRVTEPTVVMFPDKGAKERYQSLLNDVDTMWCEKIRNQLTGAIEGLNIVNGHELRSYDRVLIVDDICDGGRTFIEVAKEINKLGVTEINLYTTHGIYSKGTDVLRDAGIDRIFNYKGEVF